MSLMFCHNAGSYTFTIYDNFCGSIPLLVIALFECVGVAYFYGLQRFSEDIELMTGSRPGLFLCLCWKYVSPTIMTAILVSFFTKMIFGDLSYEVRIQTTIDRRRVKCFYRRLGTPPPGALSRRPGPGGCTSSLSS